MTVTTGVPTLVRGRAGRYLPFVAGAVLVVFMALLPLLNISIPGILPGATYTPGTLALLSLCMVFAALALSYNLLLGTGGVSIFGQRKIGQRFLILARAHQASGEQVA